MSEDRATEALLNEAVAGIDAPDAVIAVTRRGQRIFATGGAAPPPATPREEQRYELGSASKTFAVLLLAELARSGELSLDDPLYERLPELSLRHAASRLITLRDLAAHTSGLPRIPLALVPGALLHPHENAYAGYGTVDLLNAFAHARPRPCPGTRWRYSNFGGALIGLAVAHTTGTAYPDLLNARVLRPLGLAAEVAVPSGTGGTADAAGTTGTSDAGGAAGADAVGHRADGRTPVPGTAMGGFSAAGGVRATPGGSLSFLEAHLAAGEGQLNGRRPEAPHLPDRAAASGTALGYALRDVQRPLLRRGLRRHTHTLTWFLHPGPEGPLLFHAGATFGQQAFLGYHPVTGTGLVALATRHGQAARLVTTAYELLHTLARHALADRACPPHG